MALREVREVLEFLRENGFERAATALREDAVASYGGSGEGVDLVFHEGEEDGLRWLPPVRIGVRHDGDDWRSGSESSISSDAFVSMASSPSGFASPYSLWPGHSTKSEESSDRLSQFSTACDYHDPNIFGDTFWEVPHPVEHPSVGVQEEDMFVTSVQAEEKFIMENGLPSGTNLETSPSDCSKAYGASVTECEKQIQKSNYTVQVKGSNLFLQKIQSSVPSSSCNIGERELPLNLLDDHENGLESGLSCGNFQSSEQHEAAEYLEPHILEKERDTLSSFDLPNDKDFHKECGSELFHKSDSRLHVNNANKSKYGITDKESPNRDFAGGKVDCGIRKELQLCDLDEEYEVFDLRIIHKKNRTGFEENKDFPIAMNSIIAGRYCVTEHLGSATFSKVIQAHDLLTGMDVCLKIIKNDKDFFDQSLDEIKLLKLVNKHDPADEHHILRLYDYFYYQEHLFIVSELLRANLYEFQKLNEESGGEIYFTLARIQKIARQCLEGLEFLHSLSIIHCDLKPENILIKSYRRCKIKIIDLGSSCFRTDNLCLYVQSRSYRAPEVILGLPYDEKIDIWSLGCVLAELFTGEVLFPNHEAALLLSRMIEIFGPMDSEMLDLGKETHKYFTDDRVLYRKNEVTDRVERITPGRSTLSSHLGSSDLPFIGFLGYLLQMNPQKRPTAEQALQHPWLSHL